MVKHMLAVAFAVSVSLAGPVAAGVVDNIQIEGQILERVTPEWLAKAKTKHAVEFAYLGKLERDSSLPTGTLQVMWVVESMCGEMNITNSHGYEGHFQFGKYEQKMFGLDNPRDFTSAAKATVLLLRSYHIKSQQYHEHPVMWQQRSAADFYMLHQQGYRGSAAEANAIQYERALGRSLHRNIRSNIPARFKAALYDSKGRKNPGITDQDLTEFFYKLWEHEFSRIWTAIK